jgi:hypothetical protein
MAESVESKRVAIVRFWSTEMNDPISKPGVINLCFIFIFSCGL